VSSEATTGRIEVAGGHLVYERAGEGAPIVWIHAAIADQRMWDREFELYAKGWTVVRYDVRGLGRSPPASAPYSDVEDLQALLQHLRISPATVVGCSNGGRIAIDFALEHPEMVSALLLVAPGLSGWTPSMDPEGQSVYDQGAARSAKIAAAWSAGHINEALTLLRVYWASAQEGANADLVDRMMRENAVEIFTDASAQHNVGIEPPAAERLGSIRVPALVLFGDRDEPTLEYIARRVALGIPHARLVSVPRADHLVNLSRPDALDAALRELLR
jgi:pimeloyl-ACP methyl ester carboxylesterase